MSNLSEEIKELSSTQRVRGETALERQPMPREGNLCHLSKHHICSSLKVQSITLVESLSFALYESRHDYSFMNKVFYYTCSNEES
jgi:hypothetical protein